MPTPDLPTTEAEAHAMLRAMRMRKYTETMRNILDILEFERQFNAARDVLGQDPVTAYATAVRAVEQRYTTKEA